ncbi:hypothetical protein LMG28688_00804 [Paraburkholderia caffeinitolerans]|uniref:Uncharacterized protein n=1 Tax=Paraburkholderia caffeinitolerans TaxID=1723730 RepID=A0A6J5FGT9_9BURK|nr:hypothetical protein [Paraburkholderia caffeinitolerans]CAB3779323.1 hypothetical protein LMG28688_00804 [Paraburkholderia caffeinitolerans]
MTDIELMQRAAKAAGIKLDVWEDHRGDGTKDIKLRFAGAPHAAFDPLASDADAFQVLIGSGVRVLVNDHTVVADAGAILFNYHYTGDRAAATRKAIVEVAAVLV